MRYTPKDGGWLELVIILLIVGLLLFSWPICSYFEARAYNNITGKNVSTWDAMFVELRVQEGAKE